MSQLFRGLDIGPQDPMMLEYLGFPVEGGGRGWRASLGQLLELVVPFGVSRLGALGVPPDLWLSGASGAKYKSFLATSHSKNQGRVAEKLERYCWPQVSATGQVRAPDGCLRAV